MRALLRRSLAAATMTAATSGLLAAMAPPALAAGDDYPWRASYAVSDSWGFGARQCVSFVAWRLHQHRLAAAVSGWGDAAAWDDRARAAGRVISSRPKPGAVAHWNAGERSTWVSGGVRRTFTAGARGHVAWVSGIYANGLVRLESYNALGTRTYSVMPGTAVRYIYFA